ncbi:hypothetical protein KC19_10G063100 [Ceratodon purpureus]|uniref:Uncharacterized protein n=1 Tax=Ceratodon purpureus TaxID=3225 RepID=A0A8T0GMC8_CERPU|nr:hypothetical protein KC19_10G063100 [Ceratodon purpureus]
MQESTMASTKSELQESQMVSTEKDKDAIRNPSINTEPRTLDEMKMESAMITAQKIYAKHPSADFTKDALDTATRENAPAEDAADGNSLQTHPDDFVQEAGNVVDSHFTSTEGPPAPPPTPAI